MKGYLTVAALLLLVSLGCLTTGASTHASEYGYPNQATGTTTTSSVTGTGKGLGWIPEARPPTTDTKMGTYLYVRVQQGARPAESESAGVTYHGGLVLSNSFLFVVFWGSDWKSNSQLLQRIYVGLQTIVDGGYFDGLDEYGYGSLTLIGYMINDVMLSQGQVIMWQEFDDFVSGLVITGTIPRYHSQVLFILPTRHDIRAQAASRFDAAGFHFSSLTDFRDSRSIIGLSVVQTGSLIEDILSLETSFTGIMQAATHELVSAITDPSTVDGWYGTERYADQDFSEIPDICWRQSGGLLRPSIAGVPVSYYWSDSKGECVYHGGNGLQPVTLSISKIPTGQCVTVKWNTNLATLEQPACLPMQWRVRATLGSTVQVSPTIFNVDAGTRYLLSSGTNAWTVASPVTVPVNYVEQFFLSVSSQYGSVSGEGWYNYNSVAYASLDRTIVDTGPNSRVRFLEWTGHASGSSLPVEVMMDRPKRVSATWMNQFYLTVIMNPPGLAQLQGEGWYDSGSVIRLAAGHQVNEYVFASWNLDGIVVSDSTTTIVMDRPHEAAADYVLPSITAESINPQVDIAAGQQETVLVSVSPMSVQRILVEYSTDTSDWMTLTQGSTDDSGILRVPFTPPSTGIWYLRASILNAGGQPIAMSETGAFTAVPESICPLLLLTAPLITVNLFLKVRTRRNRDMHRRN